MLIVNAETGEKREITAGNTADALYYELEDMEKAVINNDPSYLHLQHTCDVMEIMTRLRKDWGMKYPGEIW